MNTPKTPERTDWVLVILLWLAGLGAAAQYGKVSVVYDLLGQLYPNAGTGLGFAVSLVGFTGMLLGVVAGLLVARIRYRRAIIGGLVLGAVVSLFQAALPSFPLLLGSRVLEGVAHLAIVVAAPTLIAEVTAPRHAGFALTLWGTFFGVAFAVLVFAGLPLVDVGGVPALFVAHAIFMALMAGLLLWRLPRRERDQPSVSFGIGSIVRKHHDIYSSPFISAAGIGWLFYATCFVSLLTLLPPFIAPEYRAFVIGAMPLISIASSMTLGVFLLRFLPAVRVIETGFVAAAIFAILLIWTPGSPLLCLALAASQGLVQGASFAAVPQLNEDTSARAAGYGAMAQTGNIGNTLGTPLLAAIITMAGHTGAMIAVAILFTIGATAHFVLGKRRLG